MFKNSKTLKRFDRAFIKLDRELRDCVQKAMRQLFSESLPNSLRFKKVKGHRGIYEISGNMDIRITFSIDDEKNIIFRNCGHHDEVLNNP
jgi:mRNA-degrading endonuclease YafQ of YafQ-DinJ toxin-antitoxin module